MGALLKLLQKGGKFLNKNSPIDLLTLKSLRQHLVKDVGTQARKGDYTKAIDALGISGVVGLLANQWNKWSGGTEKGSFGESEYPRYSAGNMYGQNDEYWEQLTKEKLEGIKMGEMDKMKLKEFKEKGGEKLWEGDSGWIHDYADRYATHKAQGGRIGLAGGMTPSESWMRDYFYSGKGGYDDSGMTFDFFQKNIGPDLWYKHIGKAKGGRIGYDNGGSTEQEDYDAYVAEKEGAGEEYMEFDMWKQFQLFDWGKAQGGRIGFKEGEGIMSRVGDMVDVRNVPYYSGKGLQGLVNSAETLSKFPLAAGELGSKLLREKPSKKMFMEAIENITPGSWSENLGLTSLVEGMGENKT